MVVAEPPILETKTHHQSPRAVVRMPALQIPEEYRAGVVYGKRLIIEVLRAHAGYVVESVPYVYERPGTLPGIIRPKVYSSQMAPGFQGRPTMEGTLELIGHIISDLEKIGLERDVDFTIELSERGTCQKTPSDIFRPDSYYVDIKNLNFYEKIKVGHVHKIMHGESINGIATR